MLELARWAGRRRTGRALGEQGDVLEGCELDLEDTAWLGVGLG